MSKPIFRAITNQREILEWYAPQTFSHVFKTFKLHCDLSECVGELYCGDVLLRRSGRGSWDDKEYDLDALFRQLDIDE